MSAWKFEVGKQVVCKAGKGYWESASLGTERAGPENGDILTVSSIELDDADEAWLGFDGHDPERLFDARWFEPVRPTSIGLFQKLLAPTDTKVKEFA